MITREYDDKKTVHRPAVIDTRLVAVRVAVCLFGSVLIAVGSSIHIGAGIMCVAVLGLTLFLGWPRLVKIPHANMARFGISLLLLVALGVANWGEIHQMAFVLALGIIMSFGAEMLRRDGRAQMLEQASATFVADLLCVAASVWLFVWKQPNGHNLSLVFAVVIAVVAMIEAIETKTSHILAFINALIVGSLMGWLCGLSIGVGLLAGLSVSVVYVALARARKEATQPRSLLSEASCAVIPHCILGVVAYACGLLLM